MLEIITAPVTHTHAHTHTQQHCAPCECSTIVLPSTPSATFNTLWAECRCFKIIICAPLSPLSALTFLAHPEQKNCGRQSLAQINSPCAARPLHWIAISARRMTVFFMEYTKICGVHVPYAKLHAAILSIFGIASTYLGYFVWFRHFRNGLLELEYVTKIVCRLQPTKTDAQFGHTGMSRNHVHK